MFYTTTWFFEEGCRSTTERQMWKLCSTTARSQSVDAADFYGMIDESEQIKVRLGQNKSTARAEF